MGAEGGTELWYESSREYDLVGRVIDFIPTFSSSIALDTKRHQHHQLKFGIVALIEPGASPVARHISTPRASRV